MAGSTDELNFESLEPTTVPVTFKGRKYVLKEASSDATCKWRNSGLQGAQVRDGKVSSLGNVADLEPLLVSLCLFDVTDGGEKPVPLKTVREWPYKVVSALFNRARDISGLAEEEDTEESLTKRIDELTAKRERLLSGESDSKNSPESTPAGSG
jgi:hypothetical protein